MNAEDTKRRLTWQCRRGLKETDVVVNAYLNQHFLNDSPAHQALFEQLLTCSDPDLFEWFTRRSQPQDPALAGFIDHVLGLLGTEKTAYS